MNLNANLQVVMDALDWTGIEGCNAAFQSALETVESMVME